MTRLAFWTAQVVLALAAAPASAERPARDVQQDLERGERAYATLDFDEALAAGTRVARERGLSHEHLVRATRLLALANAVLGNEAASRDAAVVLLEIAPGFQLDGDASPKVRAPLQEARLYWRDQPVKPGLDAVAVVPAGEPGAVRVTLRDPSHRARRVTVGYRWGVVGEYVTRTQRAEDAVSVSLPTPVTGAARLDYFAQALDERDSVAFEAGSPAAPRTAVADGVHRPSAAPARGGLLGSPWFWAAAGALAIGGGATAFALTRASTTGAVAPDRSILAPGVTCGGASCN